MIVAGDNGPEGDDLVAWHAWLNDKPPAVRKVAGKCPPWKHYRFGEFKRLCRLLSYGESLDTGAVTVTVLVLEGPTEGFGVFGVDPATLVPVPAAEVEALRAKAEPS